MHLTHSHSHAQWPHLLLLSGTSQLLYRSTFIRLWKEVDGDDNVNDNDDDDYDVDYVKVFQCECQVLAFYIEWHWMDEYEQN